MASRLQYVCVCMYIPCSIKKEDTKFMKLALSILNQFLKFFHWQTQICPVEMQELTIPHVEQHLLFVRPINQLVEIPL